ncbi:L-lactate dehydrogenase [Paenibacillus sp. SC116]|nr:L-lactate dehydrogenase [Paenibacillus sp. SC116]MCR8845190.1 L-lactate dehydrogenase [Paenibacillus sp. SC116]
MASDKRKVAIIGTGLVGSSIAYCLVNQGVCDEIALIDINRERAVGEAMDLTHCTDFTPWRTYVQAGGYELCADADVVVITAGGPPKAGQTRLDTLGASAKITESIVPEVMKSGFQGLFVIASNPVDIITHYTWTLSGLPRSRVIGTGTTIDSSRLKTLLSETIQTDPRSIHVYTLGEHGDSQFAAWSHATIGGKPLQHVIADNPARFSNLDLDDLVEKTKKAGWEIYNRKGTTYYGIANAAVYIIRSIFNDDQKIIPVSTVLDGEYGYTGVTAGVPAVIGRAGIREVVQLHLSTEEQQKFDHSVNLLKQYMSSIGLES